MKQKQLTMAKKVSNIHMDSVDIDEFKRLRKDDDLEKGDTTKYTHPKIYELDQNMGLRKLTKKSHLETGQENDYKNEWKTIS